MPFPNQNMNVVSACRSSSKQTIYTVPMDKMYLFSGVCPCFLVASNKYLPKILKSFTGNLTPRTLDCRTVPLFHLLLVIQEGLRWSRIRFLNCIFLANLSIHWTSYEPRYTKVACVNLCLAESGIVEKLKIKKIAYLYATVTDPLQITKPSGIWYNKGCKLALVWC